MSLRGRGGGQPVPLVLLTRALETGAENFYLRLNVELCNFEIHLLHLNYEVCMTFL
jgi:hypothetical protein